MDDIKVSAGPGTQERKHVAVNKDRVRLLVEALESGEYEQATGTLAKVDDTGKIRYCCLGVATLLALQADSTLEPVTGCNKACCRDEEDDPTRWYTEGILSDDVKNWYGFERADPTIDVGPDAPDPLSTDAHRAGDPPNIYSATGCNDTLKLTFPQIAAAFRRTFLDEGSADGGQ